MAGSRGAVLIDLVGLDRASAMRLRSARSGESIDPVDQGRSSWDIFE